LERHREGTARLLSVILRPCDWTHTDLSQFLVTPKDGRPITQWPDRDEAFLDVTQSIRRAIDDLGLANPPKQVHNFVEKPVVDAAAATLPRSANLRLRKKFTKADEDRFLLDSFEYIDQFFQISLQELEARNTDVETRHRRIDANCFTATIYQNGDKTAACTIRFGGRFGGLTYAQGDDGAANSFNESLSVQKDDQKMFLRPMGMAHFGATNSNSALSNEGAAEYLWSMLIRPIQGD
jgi:hypothetical protein